jgi:hypothetical protein
MTGRGLAMEVDYPAAHSMDTTWFAVDRDGHVALFDSGESGAVPIEATLEDPIQLLDHLSRVVPTGEVVYELAGRITPGPSGAKGEHEMSPSSFCKRWLCFLRSPEPLRGEVTRGQAVLVATSTGTAVLLSEPNEALVARLHESGACLGCFYHFDDNPPDPAFHGLFAYSHLGGNTYCSPYGLFRRPARSIHIDQLPPALREQVGQMEFHRLRFAETPHIQPCEMGQVACWESAYLSLDGTTLRRIPSNIIRADEDYAAFYAEMTADGRDWLNGLRIEPPPAE